MADWEKYSPIDRETEKALNEAAKTLAKKIEAEIMHCVMNDKQIDYKRMVERSLSTNNQQC